MNTNEEPKIKIFLNTNITMSRGKYAAHAVHAALTAFGVHPGIPVVVLGAKPRDIEAMRVSIHDEGRTELEPGTLTAGTDYAPNITLAAVWDEGHAAGFRDSDDSQDGNAWSTENPYRAAVSGPVNTTP